jgi:iron complex transport system ATP-binding protein
MALAQGTDLLLLDEPTTYLDVAHQVEMLDLLAELNARRGTTIVMVLHDLNLSARYADHLVALHTGQIVAEGSPREVVTEEVVRTVFGLDNRVIDDPVSHTPLVVPVGRHQPRRPSPSTPARHASQEIR